MRTAGGVHVAHRAVDPAGQHLEDCEALRGLDDAGRAAENSGVRGAVHHHVDPGVFLEPVAHQDVGPADQQDMARTHFHIVRVLAEARDHVDRRQVTGDRSGEDEEIR
jgi:predicted outer membrane protein